MYESHFGLLRRPFLATPDPDCCVPSESVEIALAALTMCIEGGKGFGILSAPAGTGKTLLCRKLIVDLRDRYATVFLANSNFPTRRSLLQAILFELGHPYMRMAEQELRLGLTSAARNVRPEKQAVLLVVDEAHLLTEQLLEELRTAANIDQDGAPLIHVVLSGQLDLEEKLISPRLEALNQRVGCQVTLESLTREESKAYIAHRLRWAGANLNDVFDQAAMQVICHAADGLPRCLNQLCDHALLLSYVAEESPVSEATVRDALEDLKQLPLHWNEPLPVSTPLEQLRTEAAAKGHVRPEAVVASVPFVEVGQTDEPAAAESSDGVIEIGGTSSVEVGAPVEFDLEDNDAPSVIEVGAIDERDVLDPRQIEADWPIDEEFSEPEAFEEFEPMEVEFQTVPISSLRESAGFEEEVVVDRYAMLDAGLTAADGGKRKTETRKVTATGESDESDESRTVAELSQISADERHNPEDLLDVIEPLISDVLNDVGGEDVIESAVSVSETLIGPPAMEVESEWNGVELGAPEYDVVQPAEPGNLKFTPENSAAKRRGRYAQLFSKLRRQQKRSA